MPFGFSARPVQIATAASPTLMVQTCSLPPHAPCRLQPNWTWSAATPKSKPLPPHAPCRLQPNAPQFGKHRQLLCLHTLRADCNKSSSGRRPAERSFASTRSVQIATQSALKRWKGARTLPPHAPCRLQLQKCTELQYTLFRTRVELVDSFSVLNKSMLR